MSPLAGDKVPEATFKHFTSDGSLEELSTDDLFSGKRVVVFAVPGAFTPTCSKEHVPGFITASSELKAKGVDTIACVSVNDAFVMDAWGKELGAGNDVLMLADGNGEFTQAMDLELDASAYGLGSRSQRYAMVVDDGVIRALHVEPGPGLSCSSADHILKVLDSA